MGESRIVDKLVCENCGSEEFLKGARGGMAINVFCAKCNKYYNICPLPNGKIWIINE